MEDVEKTKTFDIENNPKIEVIFNYSIEDEVKRVRYACDKYEWYRTNGYSPTYPKPIKEKLDNNEKIEDDDIESAVKEEFGLKDENIETSMSRKWEEISETFFEKLKTLGLPLQQKYYILLTQYGTAGSYGFPNTVQLNYRKQVDTNFIIAHEIVHLTVEHLVQNYGIDHWTKERIVDLIMNKFFPERQKLQKDPENAEKVSEIFDRSFPNIEEAVKEISQI